MGLSLKTIKHDLTFILSRTCSFLLIVPLGVAFFYFTFLMTFYNGRKSDNFLELFATKFLSIMPNMLLLYMPSMPRFLSKEDFHEEEMDCVDRICMSIFKSVLLLALGGILCGMTALNSSVFEVDKNGKFLNIQEGITVHQTNGIFLGGSFSLLLTVSILQEIGVLPIIECIAYPTVLLMNSIYAFGYGGNGAIISCENMKVYHEPNIFECHYYHKKIRKNIYSYYPNELFDTRYEFMLQNLKICAIAYPIIRLSVFLIFYLSRKLYELPNYILPDDCERCSPDRDSNKQGCLTWLKDRIYTSGSHAPAVTSALPRTARPRVVGRAILRV